MTRELSDNKVILYIADWDNDIFIPLDIIPWANDNNDEICDTAKDSMKYWREAGNYFDAHWVDEYKTMLIERGVTTP